MNFVYSTTITMHPINDTYIAEGFPDNNYGDKNYAYVYGKNTGSDDKSMILKFNTTGLIPNNVNIESAVLNMTLYNNGIDVGEWMNVTVQQLYNNHTWSENNATWNNALPSAPELNTTLEDYVYFTSVDGSPSCTTCWYDWSTTYMTQNAYSNSNDLQLYVSAIKESNNLEAIDWVQFESRETGAPYYTFLTITYNLNIPTVTLSKPVDSTNLLYQNRPFRFNFSVSSGDAITNASLYGNWSGTWKINQTNTSSVSKTETIFNFDFINISRGTGYVWNVEVCDIDGNCTFASTNNTFNVSNTLPVVTPSITPAPAQATDNLIGVIGFTDADGDSNSINQTRWYNNSIYVPTFDNITIIGSGNITLGSNWTFSAKSFDGFDYSLWVNSSTINVGDTTSPTLNTINITNKSTIVPLNTIVNLTAICIDGGSSINWVKYSILPPNNTYHNISTSTNNGDTYYYELTLNQRGNWTFNSTFCQDSSNNVQSNTSYEYWVYVDDTPPSITDISVPSATTSDLKLNITMNCTDITSSLNLAKVTINSSGVLTNYSMTQGGDLWHFAQTYGVGTYSTTNLYCEDTSTNSNTTLSVNSFSITAPVNNSGGESNGGGNSGVSKEDIDTAVTQAIVQAAICGNNACQEGENPLSCAVDCPANLDELLCPLIGGGDCATWAFNFLLYVVIGVPIFFVYRNQSRGGKKRK